MTLHGPWCFTNTSCPFFLQRKESSLPEADHPEGAGGSSSQNTNNNRSERSNRRPLESESSDVFVRDGSTKVKLQVFTVAEKYQLHISVIRKQGFKEVVCLSPKLLVFFLARMCTHISVCIDSCHLLAKNELVLVKIPREMVSITELLYAVDENSDTMGCMDGSYI